jgi:hypothetical protein
MPEVVVNESQNIVTVIQSSPNLIEITSSSQPATRIRSGSGVPADELGRLGDFYFDIETAGFYGPKTADGWGTPIILGEIGPPGPTGETGPVGPQGPMGPAFNYTHTQDVPALVWTIVHNADLHPSVTVVDSQDEVIECVVEYQDSNTVIVRLSYLTAGKAYLN